MSDFALVGHSDGFFGSVSFFFLFLFLPTLPAAHRVNCMFSALAVCSSVFFRFFHVDS